MTEFANPCAFSGVYVDEETARMTDVPAFTRVTVDCPHCGRHVAVVGTGRDARYDSHAELM